MAVSNYELYKKLYLEDPNNKKSVQGQKDLVNQNAKDAELLIKDNYNLGVEDVNKSYQELVDANAVDRLVAERQIAESMANAGLTQSGFNTSQNTALALGYSNAQNEARLQKQAAVETLAKVMRESLTTLDSEKKSALQSIDDSFNESANKFATEQIDRDNKEAERIATKAEESKKSDKSALLSILANENYTDDEKREAYLTYINTYGHDQTDIALTPYAKKYGAKETKDDKGNVVGYFIPYTEDDVQYYKKLWNSRNIDYTIFSEKIAEFGASHGWGESQINEFIKKVTGTTVAELAKKPTLRGWDMNIDPNEYNYVDLEEGTGDAKWGLMLNSKYTDEYGVTRTMSDIFYNLRLYYVLKAAEEAGENLTQEQIDERVAERGDIWDQALSDAKDIQEKMGHSAVPTE